MSRIVDLYDQKPINILQKPNKIGPLTFRAMTEQGIVKESLVEIFRRNGYTDLNRLTQRDFDHVSHKIENVTGILISGITIKRLLGGNFSRLPQVATLDAISKYLGHRSWQEYKSAIREKGESFEVPERPLPKQVNFKFAAVPALIIVVIAVLAFIQFNKTKAHSNFGKASFSMRKTTANDIPNTVVFNYNVDDVEADSFFIQQSWDKGKKVRVFKNNHTLTDIYFEPGYHIAKLIANDSVIRAIDVSIPTNGWFLFSKDNMTSKPEYIATNDLVSNGLFRVTEQAVRDNKIDVGKEKQYVYTFFPDKMEVGSDNFILKTKVRVKEIKRNFCPYIALEVFTQKYPMFFTSTPTGCASESMLQFGEQFVSGKDRDLASLGADVTKWLDLELSVKNKLVKIRINDKDVFSTSYKNTSKLITGLGFISNGLCEIDFVELKGLDGKVVYENDFENDIISSLQ